MAKGKYTVAVDLGENQVVAVAGCVDDSGELEISAVAKRPTKGLRAGRIENIAQINGALSGAIAELESKLNVEIQQAYGGISGEFIRCEHHTEAILIDDFNSGVAHSDVMALNNLMRSVLAPDSDTILESVPENYSVDNNGEVKNPVGVFGRTLSSTFNFTLCEKEALKRLNLAFIQAGIKMKSCFANSVMAAEAVLTKDEKEAGVAVVDLGEGITNVAIYYRGTLRYMISIPIGGSAINHDLRSLMIQERNVDSTKINSGCAIATLAEKGSVNVEGRTHRENRSVPIYNISVAIQERMTDIIIFVQREIRDAGYEGRLPYGIVLTGGGANLRYVSELFHSIMDVDVRVAVFEDILLSKSAELVASPEYATVLGILKRGVEIDSKDIGNSCTVMLEEEEVSADVAKPEESDEQSHKEEVIQTELELEDIEDDRDEDEDDEDEEDDDSERHKGGGSLLGFFKNVGEKMNNFFNSSGDTEM